jgi:hypothetical protein
MSEKLLGSGFSVDAYAWQPEHELAPTPHHCVFPNTLSIFRIIRSWLNLKSTGLPAVPESVSSCGHAETLRPEA